MPAFPAPGNVGPLLGRDLLEQVDATVGIAPFVVVPGDEFEELVVELDARTGVKDAGAGVVDEVAGNDLVLGVAEDALEVGLAGLLHGGADLLVAGGLGSLNGEVDDGNGRGRHAEGHSGELALHLGADKGNGLRGSGGGGDDVDRCGAAALPVLLGRTVDGLLGGGVAVHGGHETLLDAESFLEEDVDDGCEAVGGAAGVRDDAVLGDVELLVVHAHDDGDILVLGRSGDDHLLGSGGEVTLCLLALGEETSRLDDDIDVEILPGKGSRSFLDGEALDLVAVDYQSVVLGNLGGGFLAVDLALEDALGGVVLDEVGEVVGRNQVIDGDDFVPLFEESLFDDGTEDKAADAAEPINGDIWHGG